MRVPPSLLLRVQQGDLGRRLSLALTPLRRD